MTVLLIAIAGGVGAVVRHLVERLPLGTVTGAAIVVVNVTGSFALGVLVGAGADRDTLLIAGTGFLGGYTTLSAASVLAAEAVLDRRAGAALLHTAVMVTLCVAAAAAGVRIGA